MYILNIQRCLVIIVKKLGVELAVIFIAIVGGCLAYLYLYKGGRVLGSISVKSAELYAYPETTSEGETPINVVISVNNGYPVNVKIKSGELKVVIDSLEFVKASVPSQEVSQGLNKLTIHAVLSNMLIDEFWYQHLSKEESSDISLEGSLTFETPVGDVALPVKFSAPVKTSIFPIEQRLDRGYDMGVMGKVVLRSIKIELEGITPYKTELKASIIIENDLKAVPLYINGLVFSIRTHRMTVLGKGEQMGAKAIAPGETDTIVFSIAIDNANIPKLWYEHVTNKEITKIYIEMWLKINVKGRTIELFKEMPLTVSTEFKTSIFKYK